MTAFWLTHTVLVQHLTSNTRCEDLDKSHFCIWPCLFFFFFFKYPSNSDVTLSSGLFIMVRNNHMVLPCGLQLTGSSWLCQRAASWRRRGVGKLSDDLQQMYPWWRQSTFSMCLHGLGPRVCGCFDGFTVDSLHYVCVLLRLHWCARCMEAQM